MKFDDDQLVGKLESLEFGETVKVKEFETKIKYSTKNAPLFIHLHLMKAGIHPDPLKSAFDPLNGIYKRLPLLRNMKRPSKKVNLLEKNAPITSSKTDNDDLVPYWYPQFYVNLVNYDQPLDSFAYPPYVRRYIYADRIRKQYYPIVYFNELWELKKYRIPILDDEEREYELKISVSSISFMMFLFMNQIDFAIKNQEAVYGEHNEFESIKQMFLETSPILIAITFAVSLLHSIFDFLAFKNGINYCLNMIF